MAINPDYPAMTWEDANPFQVGLMKSKELLAKQLANQYAQEQNKIAGVKARYEEPLTMQELVSKNLMNRINEIKSRYEEPQQKASLEKALLYNKFYGPNIQSEIGLRGAQAGHLGEQSRSLAYARAHPLMQATGTQNIGALLADPVFGPIIKKQLQERGQMPGAEGAESAGIPGMQQLGGPQQPGPLMQPGETPIQMRMPEQQAPDQTNAEKLVQSFLPGGATNTSYSFGKLSKGSQDAIINKIEDMGYNRQQATQLAAAGTDLDELARAKGYENAQGAPARPTTATKTQLTRMNMAAAGVKTLDDYVEKGIGQYIGGPTIHGVPARYYYDSLEHGHEPKTVEKQSDFIAATVLAQDQALARARQAGIPLSQGVLKHTLNTALTNMRGSFPFTSPEAFKLASEKIQKALDKVKDEENKAAIRPIIPERAEGTKQKPINELSDQEIEELLGKHRSRG
jgi:hypothetical protein